MPKRIRNVIVVIFLILLGILLFRSNKSSPKLSIQKSNQSQTNDLNQKDQNNKPGQPSPNLQANTPLPNFLQDIKTPIESRVYRVKDLDLNIQSPKGRENIEALIVFINSENPFQNDPQAQQPHTYKAIQFKKEASLRTYSIKRLSTSLPLKELIVSLNKVIDQAKDPTLVRIAKQVLEAKKNGQDYFENTKQGIRSLPVPGSKDKDEDENEDHSSHTHH